MKIHKDIALIATGVLLLAVVVILPMFKVGPELFPEEATTLEFDASCDLQAGPCSLTLPAGGSIELDITPRPIKQMKDLQVSVQLKDQPAKKVLVDFIGVSMNMGMNRFELKGDGKDKFTGTAILPVCVRSRMDWEAQVWLAAPDGAMIAPFRFFTDKN